MKKLLITSLLIGGVCGAGLAQAQAVIDGAVVVHDRHSNVGIYYQQPPAYAPVYYPRPRPVYYAQPVYYGPPGYYERPYRWGPPRHRHHHHHHHDRYYDRY